MNANDIRKGTDYLIYYMLCIVSLGFACFFRILVSIAIHKAQKYDQQAQPWFNKEGK